METPQTVEHPTFESVWASFQESRKEMQEIREMQRATDRQIKETSEQMKETDRQMKETDRIVNETSKQIGKLGNRFGEIVEHIVAPNLREKFRELGLKFHQANLNTSFSDDHKILFEVDVFLENGDKALLVEIKTKPSTEDVNDHIERLGKMRAYADSHGDKRAFLGAVAGVVMTDTVKEYALKQGLYVLEPSGETFNIVSPIGKAKEW